MVAIPTLLNAFLALKNRHLLVKLHGVVERINNLADHYRRLSDQGLLGAFQEVRDLTWSTESFDKLEIPLFAIIREAATRTVGMCPFDVQILAALVLRPRKVIQMDTGEGKTLVAPFAAIADVLMGQRVM